MRKWTCPTCGRKRATAFCPSCGEKPLRESDLTLADLGGQLLREFSSVDGKLARSLRALLTRPGALSVAHVAGRRQAYLGPLQLFFVANALFVAIQSLTHANIFSSPLASHLDRQDWSPLARSLVGERLGQRGGSLAAYAQSFDRAACGAYLYLAIGAFYEARGLPRIAKSVALAIFVGALIVLYRFAIFLITFAMT